MPVKVNRAMFATGIAVTADAGTAAARQHLLEERHLSRSRFLNTQNVGSGLIESRAKGVLPRGPVNPFPRQALVLAAMDVPGHHPDQGGIRLRRRRRPTEA